MSLIRFKSMDVRISEVLQTIQLEFQVETHRPHKFPVILFQILMR